MNATLSQIDANQKLYQLGEQMRSLIFKAMSNGHPLEMPADAVKHLQDAMASVHAAQRLFEATLA